MTRQAPVTRRSRQTGHLVTVGHYEDVGLEGDANCVWYTICDEHAECVGHDTYRLARDHAPYPIYWCEQCHAEAVKS
jgi:hypothetical protein